MRLVPKDIGNMGHMCVVGENDNEPAMKALASRMKEMRSYTVIEESPEYEPQPNLLARRSASLSPRPAAS